MSHVGYIYITASLVWLILNVDSPEEVEYHKVRSDKTDCSQLFLIALSKALGTQDFFWGHRSTAFGNVFECSRFKMMIERQACEGNYLYFIAHSTFLDVL